jgi:repressor LexA
MKGIARMHDASVLSLRQRQMLEMIREFSAEYGYPPTIRQIGESVGISSTSVVSYNLSVLQRRGYLSRDRDVSRGLRLVGGAAVAVAEPSEMEFAVSTTPWVTVPILGVIAAGSPIPIPDSGFTSAEHLTLSADMLKNADRVYALQVRGTSMIDALINDGDIVIMRHQTVAENGDMVAAWLKDEKSTTLKHFHWEKGHSLVRLQPANPLMEPIYVDPGNLEIQGKVIAVIRHLD